LLKGSPGSVESVVVEHDEDLELIADDRHIYAQIKTRSETLHESELDSFFARSRDLTLAHSSRARPGTAEIWLVTNAQVSPGLMSRLVAENIGLWSSQTVSRDEPLFPPPHIDVPASLAWCVGAASEIALTRLSPETLVWKLAAVVAYRSAGLESAHTINTSELSALFELFAAQLHHFPESPASYRAQEHEPELENERRVLLVVSISGGGKTAWASYSALHSGATIVYFDAGGMPDAAIASSLLREAVAQITAKADIAARGLIQPGASGLEGLRAVDVLARNASVTPIVVVDNVHTIDPHTVRSIIGAMKSCRWALLGQPSPRCVELEALLEIDAVSLDGWPLIAIAAEFESVGAPVDPGIAERVRQLTGGVPRFVANAAALTARFYSGDAKAFCEAVEASANTTRTAQELILRATFAHLSANAQLAVALLSLARFSLSEKECLEFLSVHEAFHSDAQGARAIAELQDWGVVQRLLSGALVTHDAFSVLAGALFEGLDSNLQMAAMKVLASVIEKSVAPGQVARLMVYCRLLPKIGRADALADIASSLSEHIHEQGRSGDLQVVLEDVLASPGVSALDRFMVADTLALWEFHQPDRTQFVRLVRIMEQLASKDDLGPECASRLVMKQMLEASFKRDIPEIRSLAAKALGGAETPMIRRIAKYNTAVAFHMADESLEAVKITEELVSEYYGVLGLTDEKVFARSAKALSDDLGSDFDTIDELRRLADVLDLRARALNNVGLQSGLCRLHALKFYQIAHVPVSLMKVGQDVVEEFISLLGDPVEARRVIESLLLPIIQEYRLVDYVVPVRGQYAVILAYCGEITAARHLIKELRTFAVSEERRNELEGQADLIEEIALKQRMRRRGSLNSGSSKVGRNEPCPCGSGQKYKKCHGAGRRC
jgi:hypothetical protein